MNEDGHIDLLSGSYSRSGRPMAGLFQVLWGRGDGTFTKAVALKGVDGDPLVIPTKGEDQITETICTRPFAVDWDADGDLDLVVSNFAGSFWLFTGFGRGKFDATPKPILTSTQGPSETVKPEHLKITGYHGDPFPIDWDGDGDLDLLSGSSQGGVQWAMNIAGKGKPPILMPFQTLIAAPDAAHVERHPNEVEAPSGSTRVWATDVNGDGKLDILLGDDITLVSPAKGVSEDDFKKRYAKWKDENTAMILETAGVTDEAKLEKIWDRMHKHRALRDEFMNEDMTGFVWLYLQK